MELYEEYEDKSGMTTVSGTVVLPKNGENLIGISIGGGSPFCPCLYIVQLYDNTPAMTEGSLSCGDEIVAINNDSVKGLTKTELAKQIQNAKEEVIIQYNKLICDPKKGKTLDIKLKKFKHRIVEGLDASTADALGISRAILCNDSLVKKLADLDKKAKMVKGVVFRLIRFMKFHQARSRAHEKMSLSYRTIAGRDSTHAAFFELAGAHQKLEHADRFLIDGLKPVIADLLTFTDTIVPDARFTVNKYADAKFEYLSYCLKIKELDDEEAECIAMREPLYRVETGNYEYRLILRCRQTSREKFSKMRRDVLEKLELVDAKFQCDFPIHAKKILELRQEHQKMISGALSMTTVFPIEADLDQKTFEYGKEAIPDGMEEIEIDPLATALENNSLIDLN